MPSPLRSDPWLLPHPQVPCACSQIRRAARKVSALFDEALQPAGLTITQHSLLVNVARAGQMSRTALAAQLGMDRTTLTRNLAPLEKSALLEPAAGEDRRERLIQISAKGRRKLRESYRLWSDVQSRFSRALGVASSRQLRTALVVAEAAAAACGSANPAAAKAVPPRPHGAPSQPATRNAKRRTDSPA